MKAANERRANEARKAIENASKLQQSEAQRKNLEKLQKEEEEKEKKKLEEEKRRRELLKNEMLLMSSKNRKTAEDARDFLHNMANYSASTHSSDDSPFSSSGTPDSDDDEASMQSSSPSKSPHATTTDNPLYIETGHKPLQTGAKLTGQTLAGIFDSASDRMLNASYLKDEGPLGLAWQKEYSQVKEKQFARQKALIQRQGHAAMTNAIIDDCIKERKDKYEAEVYLDQLKGFREGRQKFEQNANPASSYAAANEILSGGSLGSRAHPPTNRRLSFPGLEHVTLNDNGKVRSSLPLLLEKAELDESTVKNFLELSSDIDFSLKQVQHEKTLELKRPSATPLDTDEIFNLFHTRAANKAKFEAPSNPFPAPTGQSSSVSPPRKDSKPSIPKLPLDDASANAIILPSLPHATKNSSYQGNSKEGLAKRSLSQPNSTSMSSVLSNTAQNILNPLRSSNGASASLSSSSDSMSSSGSLPCLMSALSNSAASSPRAKLASSPPRINSVTGRVTNVTPPRMGHSFSQPSTTSSTPSGTRHTKDRHAHSHQPRDSSHLYHHHHHSHRSALLSKQYQHSAVPEVTVTPPLLVPFVTITTPPEDDYESDDELDGERSRAEEARARAKQLANLRVRQMRFVNERVFEHPRQARGLLYPKEITDEERDAAMNASIAAKECDSNTGPDSSTIVERRSSVTDGNSLARKLLARKNQKRRSVEQLPGASSSSGFSSASDPHHSSQFLSGDARESRLRTGSQFHDRHERSSRERVLMMMERQEAEVKKKTRASLVHDANSTASTAEEENEADQDEPSLTSSSLIAKEKAVPPSSLAPFNSGTKNLEKMQNTYRMCDKYAGAAGPSKDARKPKYDTSIDHLLDDAEPEVTEETYDPIANEFRITTTLPLPPKKTPSGGLSTTATATTTLASKPTATASYSSFTSSSTNVPRTFIRQPPSASSTFSLTSTSTSSASSYSTSLTNRAKMSSSTLSPYSSPTLTSTYSSTARAKKEELPVSKLVVNYEQIRSKARQERASLAKVLESVVTECNKMREELLTQRGVFASLLAKLPLFRTCEESSVRAVQERYEAKQAERKELEAKLLDAVLRENFASARLTYFEECADAMSQLDLRQKQALQSISIPDLRAKAKQSHASKAARLTVSSASTEASSASSKTTASRKPEKKHTKYRQRVLEMLTEYR